MSASGTGSSPIRVLHLRDSPWVDGPGRTILESGSHFDDKRVDYHVGVFVGTNAGAHPMIVAAKERAISIHPVPDSGGFNRLIVDSIVELVDRFDIQVLHTSDLRSSIYGLLARRRRPSVAIVCTAHGWIANTRRRRLMRLLDKALLRAFDRVIFVSHATRELVPRWWLPDDRSTILHNALPLATYGLAQGEHRRAMPDPARRVVLLNVGRLSVEKGQDLLLSAVARLIEDYPGIHLRFAGIGPMEDRLRAQAADLGLASHVEFLGYVPDMPSMYAEADLVVQSALTEGLPNVILEAAFLRVPVVATDVGGTSEVIEHGRSGWLIKPGSVDALANGLQWFFANTHEANRMTTSARQRVMESFSFVSRTEKMTQLYIQLAWHQRSHPDSSR